MELRQAAVGRRCFHSRDGQNGDPYGPRQICAICVICGPYQRAAAAIASIHLPRTGG